MKIVQIGFAVIAITLITPLGRFAIDARAWLKRKTIKIYFKYSTIRCTISKPSARKKTNSVHKCNKKPRKISQYLHSPWKEKLMKVCKMLKKWRVKASSDRYSRREWVWALKEALSNTISCHYYKICGNNYIMKTLWTILNARNRSRRPDRSIHTRAKKT
jgi:hypothetical protein